MRFTVSMKENRDFRRLYASGRSAVDGYLAVYVRKNRMTVNRLGITVGAKLGCAVVRNRVRRRIREAYRLEEPRLRPGFDIVVVARVRAAESDYTHLRGSLVKLLDKLGVRGA